MPKSKDPDHIDEMLEWQQKQYTPWKYGQEGKLLPIFKARGNKKNAAILFFILSGLSGVMSIAMLVTNQNLASNWTMLLYPITMSLLFFFAGLNKLMQRKADKLKRQEQLKKGKKKKRNRKK